MIENRNYVFQSATRDGSVIVWNEMAWIIVLYAYEALFAASPDSALISKLVFELPPVKLKGTMYSFKKSTAEGKQVTHGPHHNFPQTAVH